MKSVVIGYGSIGQRHASILSTLGDVAVVTHRRDACDYDAYAPEQLASLVDKADYVVIANETAKHWETLQHVRDASATVKILVEKPLSHKLPEYTTIDNPACIYVGYQLRFHPVIQALRDAIGHEAVISSHWYVGQHLSHWRHNRPYYESYSATKAQGGGVLRDLSHELDLCVWIMGGVMHAKAMMSRVSALDITSEDCANIVMQHDSGGLSNIHLNYLDRVPTRRITVNTESKTVTADLISNTLSINGELQTLATGRDAVFKAMHVDVIESIHPTACTFSEGEALVQLITAIETEAGV